MLQPDPCFVLRVHNPASSVCFLNQQLQVGTNGRVPIYCLSSLRSNYELKVGTKSVIFLHSTTESLITQDRSGVVKFWDLTKTGYQLRSEINTNYLGFAKAQIHKNFLFAPSGSSDISIIDVTLGKEIQLLKLTPSDEEIKQITSLALFTSDETENETYLLSGYESGHLILWNLKDFVPSPIKLKYDFPVTGCDFDLSVNRGVVASATTSQVCVFGIDVHKMELFKREELTINYATCERSKVSCLRIRPDKKCLVVGMCDGSINIHSWKSLRKLATLRNIHKGEITDIAFSPNTIDNFKSNIMAVSGGDVVSLWDIYYK